MGVLSQRGAGKRKKQFSKRNSFFLKNPHVFAGLQRSHGQRSRSPLPGLRPHLRLRRALLLLLHGERYGGGVSGAHLQRGRGEADQAGVRLVVGGRGGGAGGAGQGGGERGRGMVAGMGKIC